MQKLLPIILTVLYFVNSKYLLVKTKTDEGHHSTHSDYQGGESPRDYFLDETKEANDYEAGGSNLFERKVFKSLSEFSLNGTITLLHFHLKPFSEF